MRQLVLGALLCMSGVAQAELRSDGCKAPSADLTYHQVVQVGGAWRNYSFTAPSYDPAKPHVLFIEFHGYGLSADEMHFLAGGVEPLMGSEAVFAYMDAGKAGWDGSDEAFFDAVRFQLGQRYCIDLYQVFAVGYSNGAFFVNSLGQHRSRELKGIVSVAGGGGGGVGLPALVVHGRSDQFVGFGSGFGSMQAWAGSDGCKAPPSDDGHVGCEPLAGCKLQVTWCPWGGNHDWPGFLNQGVVDFVRTVR